MGKGWVSWELREYIMLGLYRTGAHTGGVIHPGSGVRGYTGGWGWGASEGFRVWGDCHGGEGYLFLSYFLLNI